MDLGSFFDDIMAKAEEIGRQKREALARYRAAMAEAASRQAEASLLRAQSDAEYRKNYLNYMGSRPTRLGLWDELAGGSYNEEEYGYQTGGKVKGRGIGAKVPIIAHEGEYIIPEDVVKEKGTKYFDRMIGKNKTKGWVKDYVGTGGEGRRMPSEMPNYQQGGLIRNPYWITPSTEVPPIIKWGGQFIDWLAPKAKEYREKYWKGRVGESPTPKPVIQPTPTSATQPRSETPSITEPKVELTREFPRPSIKKGIGVSKPTTMTPEDQAAVNTLNIAKENLNKQYPYGGIGTIETSEGVFILPEDVKTPGATNKPIPAKPEDLSMIDRIEANKTFINNEIARIESKYNIPKKPQAPVEIWGSSAETAGTGEFTVDRWEKGKLYKDVYGSPGGEFIRTMSPEEIKGRGIAGRSPKEQYRQLIMDKLQAAIGLTKTQTAGALSKKELKEMGIQSSREALATKSADEAVANRPDVDWNEVYQDRLKNIQGIKTKSAKPDTRQEAFNLYRKRYPKASDAEINKALDARGY